MMLGDISESEMSESRTEFTAVMSIREFINNLKEGHEKIGYRSPKNVLLTVPYWMSDDELLRRFSKFLEDDSNKECDMKVSDSELEICGALLRLGTPFDCLDFRKAYEKTKDI